MSNHPWARPNPKIATTALSLENPTAGQMIRADVVFPVAVSPPDFICPYALRYDGNIRAGSKTLIMVYSGNEPQFSDEFKPTVILGWGDPERDYPHGWTPLAVPLIARGDNSNDLYLGVTPQEGFPSGVQDLIFRVAYFEYWHDCST